MSLTSTTVGDCVNRCYITTGCVGAVWDGSTHCWLKSFFNTPSNSSYNLLLPGLLYGCPPSYFPNVDYVCILKYNKIPNFDFAGNVIGQSNTPVSDCELTAACIGYNSSGYYKNGFLKPHVAIGMSSYVHAVQFGMYTVFRTVTRMG